VDRFWVKIDKILVEEFVGSRNRFSVYWLKRTCKTVQKSGFKLFLLSKLMDKTLVTLAGLSVVAEHN
jgi:hypothetical protein